MVLEAVILKLVGLLRDKFHNKEIDSDLNLNQYLGTITGTLSGILQRLLERNNWAKNNWIDDILIRDIKVSANGLYIFGNTIYGKSGTTKEWVAPFLFEISFNTNWTDFVNYKCYFGRKEEKELDYTVYRKENREWDEYFNRNYNKPDSGWEYSI